MLKPDCLVLTPREHDELREELGVYGVHTQFYPSLAHATGHFQAAAVECSTRAFRVIPRTRTNEQYGQSINLRCTGQFEGLDVYVYEFPEELEG